MNRLIALGLVLVVFVVGVTVGVFGTHVFYAKRISDPGKMAEFMSAVALRRLDRTLDLSDAQRIEIEAVLADARHDVLVVRRETEPRMVAILDHTHDRIAAVLTEEQRREFDRIRERMRRNLSLGEDGDRPKG
ncbi:MAG: hypothetical protein AAGD38_15605 [Acidobacteriota bacterium]